MKRNTFAIALIAFAAVTATVGTAVASFAPTLADIVVRVRRDEATPPTAQFPLINAGTHNVPSGTAQNVIINILDNRTSTIVQRNGRTSADVLLKTASGTAAFNSSAVIN